VLLGALGGGGSSLTTPILLYVVGLPPREAIATSLLVVGASSGVATLQHARTGTLAARTGLVFGGAGMVSAFFAGKLAEHIADRALLGLFGLMLLASGVAMLTRRSELRPRTPPSPALAAAVGFGVGALTGLVGAGGGFIAVPAMVILLGMPMDRAVGTSLLVISLNALTGFLGQVTHVPVDYTAAALLGGASILGTFFGAPLAARVSPARLRIAFGLLVTALGLYMGGRVLVG
jgi:uncharacterized membrane protein YfcA